MLAQKLSLCQEQESSLTYKSAGIVPYFIDEGLPHFCLGKESFIWGWTESGKWSPFTGGIKPGENINDAAIREFHEESIGAFDSCLNKKHLNDLIRDCQLSINLVFMRRNNEGEEARDDVRFSKEDYYARKLYFLDISKGDYLLARDTFQTNRSTLIRLDYKLHKQRRNSAPENNIQKTTIVRHSLSLPTTTCIQISQNLEINKIYDSIAPSLKEVVTNRDGKRVVNPDFLEKQEIGAFSLDFIKELVDAEEDNQNRQTIQFETLSLFMAILNEFS